MTTADGAPRTRDPSATKARLLEAATEEFAAHGIAGARIDRIEAAARANRSLIYSYFTNKDGLFDAVMDAAVARVLDEVPFTAEDLPGYAGRLFDFLAANPNLLRLATWHRLERAGSGRETAGLSGSYRTNVASVTKARTKSRPASDLSAEDSVRLHTGPRQRLGASQSPCARSPRRPRPRHPPRRDRRSDSAPHCRRRNDPDAQILNSGQQMIKTREEMPKTWLITGSSRGFGWELASAAPDRSSET